MRTESELEADLDSMRRAVATHQFSEAFAVLRTFAYLDQGGGIALPRGLASGLGAATDVISFLEWGLHASDPNDLMIVNGLCDQLPWIAFIPEPTDALVNIARHAFERGVDPSPGGDPLQITLKWPEGPTAQLVLSHAIGRRVDLTVQDIPDPDPRLPRHHIAEHQAWTLGPSGLEPAFAPPPTDVVDQVVVGDAPFYPLTAALSDAHTTLHSIGPQQGLLVALATYPRRAPAGIAPWRWIRRWQVVCCLALAEIGGTRYLRDIALGPDDWLVDAALCGLRAYAARNPEHREWINETGSLVVDLAADRLRGTAISYFGSMCDLVADFADMDPDVARQIRSYGEQWRSKSH